MTQEPVTTSIKVPEKKSSNKFIWVIILSALALILLGPAVSLRNYAYLLLQTPLPSNTQRAECAVVLTGGPGRIREGITLLSHKQVQKLIISGVHQHSTLSDMFPEMLFYPEVRLDDVILERRSSSTAGNAQQSLLIVDALKCKSVILVTSDYHLFRAMKTFKLAFPSNIELLPHPVPSERLLRRGQSSFDGRFWYTVSEEWIKYVFYSFFVF